MSKIIQVSRSKYRVAVSDLLPYEKPLFISNRFFARFLKYYGICTDNGRLVATKHINCPGLKEVLSFLGGKPNDRRDCFQYSITKEGHEDGRVLTIIHPYHQVQMVEFYNRYKYLILDFCTRSNFSIRFPYEVATWQNKNDGYLKVYSDTAKEVNSAESIKNFFAYKKYDNINEFYDDYRFLNAEKKYGYLRKIDLEKCFESIDTVTLSKALFDAEMTDSEGSMPFLFAKMQKEFKNKNEGIVIGPEFSRIFAEMILQRIDVNVEKSLLNDYQLKHKEDYRIFRYVDDGFIFCDSKESADTIVSVYTKALESFGLKINQEKTNDYIERPFMDEIALIKQKLSDLVDGIFANRLETFDGFQDLQNGKIDTPLSIDYKNFVKAVRLAMKRECKPEGEKVVKYKDIMSFLLGTMLDRQHKLYKKFNDLYKQYAEAESDGIISEEGLKTKTRYEADFIKFNMELVQILFFLFCCDKRMSTSIKVVSMINRMQLFVTGEYEFEDKTISNKFPSHIIDHLNSRISHETQELFANSKLGKSNAMEIMNLLEVQKMMKSSTQISNASMMRFLESGKEEFSEYLNFMTAFELLHFIGKSSKYEALKETIFNWIENHIIPKIKPGVSDTETVLTMFELMCSPSTDDDRRMKYSKLLFENNAEQALSFCHSHKDMFIKWRHYRVEEELQQINNKTVY